MLLLGSSVVAGVLTGNASPGGVRQELFIATAAYSLVALIAGALLVVAPPQSVSTLKVAAWSIPGLAILLLWSAMTFESWAERVIVSYPMSTGLRISCGPVSPLTSIAATVLVVRLPSPTRVALCLGSWVGAIMFWLNVFGVLGGLYIGTM